MEGDYSSVLKQKSSHRILSILNPKKRIRDVQVYRTENRVIEEEVEKKRVLDNRDEKNKKLFTYQKIPNKTGQCV